MTLNKRLATCMSLQFTLYTHIYYIRGNFGCIEISLIRTFSNLLFANVHTSAIFIQSKWRFAITDLIFVLRWNICKNAKFYTSKVSTYTLHMYVHVCIHVFSINS